MPPTDPAATPDPTAATDPKQPSLAALNALMASSKAAGLNSANTPDAQAAAWKTYDAAAAQAEALDLAVFTGNTVQLQAAEAALTPGMKQLTDLKKQIAALGDGFKEAASVIGDIDQAVSALSGLV
jgi:argininosuccinate lyase